MQRRTSGRSRTLPIPVWASALVPLLVVAGLPLSASAQDHRPLPSPGGDYAVGEAEYVLADASRPDSLVAGMASGRRVNVILWYPTSDGSSLATAGRPFPVVLISHSLGGSPHLYQGLGTELASHGYVVASIGHPGGAGRLALGKDTVPLAEAWDANDPATVGSEAAFAFREARTRVWAADALYALSVLPDLELHGEEIGSAVDTVRAGYVGHSVGGSAAAMGCHVSRAFRACINLDGWPVATGIRTGGLEQPYFHIEESRPYRSDEQLDAWGVTREEYDRIQAGLDAGRDSLFQAMDGPSYHLSIDGLTHAGFSDAVFPTGDERDGDTGDGTGMAPARGLEILRDWIRWFLDRHVRQDSAARPPDMVRFPEVRFEAYGAEWSQDRPSG